MEEHENLRGKGVVGQEQNPYVLVEIRKETFRRFKRRIEKRKRPTEKGIYERLDFRKGVETSLGTNRQVRDFMVNPRNIHTLPKGSVTQNEIPIIHPLTDKMVRLEFTVLYIKGGGLVVPRNRYHNR